MHTGNDPVLSLIRNFGIEIKDVLDDPEMQEKIAEANKDYVERVAKEKGLADEYERNMDASLEGMRKFQQERGLSDEQIDQMAAFILGIITDGVMGKFSPETLDMAYKALNYDADVQSASEEGEIAGRNARISEQLRTSQKGDGTAPLSGKNNTPAPKQARSKNMFDLANEAM